MDFSSSVTRISVLLLLSLMWMSWFYSASVIPVLLNVSWYCCYFYCCNFQSLLKIILGVVEQFETSRVFDTKIYDLSRILLFRCSRSVLNRESYWRKILSVKTSISFLVPWSNTYSRERLEKTSLHSYPVLFSTDRRILNSSSVSSSKDPLIWRIQFVVLR